jgi:hypothetical protein
MIFGVAVGVRRGDMYDVIENLFPVYFEASTTGLFVSVDPL